MNRETRHRIWILGFAGLGTNIGWGLNKIFTAVLLAAQGAGVPLIGWVFGIQGLFGIILNPVTGFISDRMTTRFGRRRPFLFIAFPGATLALMLLYVAHSLAVAVLAVIIFYFFQQLSQAPYLAMMPDTCETRDYGEAAGILNVLWMLGTLVSFLLVPLVWQFVGHLVAFLLGSGILLVSGLITAFRSREQVSEMTVRPRPPVRLMMSSAFIQYLTAQALWWLGFEAIGSFFTPYMIHVLHGSILDAALSMSVFSVTAVAVSRVFGRWYRRYDARWLLGAALGLFVLVALGGLVATNVSQAFVMLAGAGVAWGGIQVISYPLAVDLLRDDLVQRRGFSAREASHTTEEVHGSVYGAVNVVQSLGLMAAGPLVGQVIAQTGHHYVSMFIVSAISFLSALILTLRLHRVHNIATTLDDEVMTHPLA